MTIFIFSHAVLGWYAQHGRKDLPWQNPITPYRVYVSEIMLQQTQVATVIPYFQRFMQAFPDVQRLAAAPLDHVLHLWTGLGYYARARNLHKAAQILVEKYQGEFPSTLTQLQSLPGIGRSTAGAICALAFNQREPILDGNVKRVLARFHGVAGWPGIKTVENQLWQYAAAHLPQTQLREYTQAMMDMGATVCTRAQPRCETCPLSESCVAFKEKAVTHYPGAKPTKTLPVRQVKLLVLIDNDKQILLKKRPALGIWGGLWSLPEIEEENIGVWCQQTLRAVVQETKICSAFRHTFSHFHLDITPIEVHIKRETMAIMEADDVIWYNPVTPEPIGLPQPIARILQNTKV